MTSSRSTGAQAKKFQIACTHGIWSSTFSSNTYIRCILRTNHIQAHVHTYVPTYKPTYVGLQKHGLGKLGLSVLGLCIQRYICKYVDDGSEVRILADLKKLPFPPPHISSRRCSQHSFSRAPSCRLDDWMLKSFHP